MNNWFECKITYDKTGEDGIIKTVSELYLVDALSFAEAEERMNREMKPFIKDEFFVAKVSRRKIAEMFESKEAEADKWYRSKVNFVTLDEEKGIEKRVPSNMYVKATNMKNALDTLLEGMKGTLDDYEIASIVETQVLDVYKYEAADQEGGEDE